MRLFNSLRPCLFRTILATFLASGLSVLYHPQLAHAQAVDEAEAEQDAMAAQQRAEDRKKAKHAAPPSAIPGADQGNEDNSHSRLDLNPTAALFDAVNKGSSLATKEALSRGADINAKNSLDQTPLDLAIDLGRNDIMFLLLSMKSYNPDGHLTTTAENETVTDKKGSKKIMVSGQASVTRRAPPQQPHYVYHDSNVQQPEAGFLGFSGQQISRPAITEKNRKKRH